ncbi:MAG: DUF502 domain-containing protein [Pseudomonadota bacterium]
MARRSRGKRGQRQNGERRQPDPSPEPKPTQQAKKAPGTIRRASTILQKLRNNFFAGIVVVAPIGLTIWLIWNTIAFVDSQVLPLVPSAYDPRRYLGADLPGYGVLVFVIFTVTVGYFGRKVFGAQLIRVAEELVDRTPVIRSIYNALKQLVETVLTNSNTSFQQACLVEYPRRGIWAVAFISTDAKGEVAELMAESDLVSVFLPTTPNPTSGFLLYVPRADVLLLDMSIEDAAKMVISAGLVVPPTEAERLAQSEEVAARRKAFADQVAPIEHEHGGAP